MAIDPAEVLRIARLARLKVEPAEAARLAKELDRIVAHIDRLRAVELPPGAESLTYFGKDVHRADEPRPGLENFGAEVANAATCRDGTR